MLTACAISSIGFGAASYWLHLKSGELVSDLKKNPYVQLPPNWRSDQGPEARERGSQSYVSAAFLGQGVLLKHVDRAGRWVLFQPSQAQIAERESAVAVQTRLEDQSTSFARIAWAWWLSCLLATVFGLVEGRHSRKVPANPTADPDARKSSARGSP